jgi:hypothetical protein
MQYVRVEKRKNISSAGIDQNILLLNTTREVQ